MRLQQSDDLAVNQTILPPDFADNDAYLAGQVFSTIVAAVAAFPTEGAAFPVAMSFVSSLVSYAVGNTTGESIPYPDIQTTIDATFRTASDNNETYKHAFLEDAIRLPLLGRLIKHGAWSFHKYEADRAVNQLSNSDRIGFYQVQLPAGFVIESYVWPTDTPDEPENSYWVVASPDASDPYVVYVLCENEQGYPVAPATLLTDLFATLQIYKPDLFRSKNGWDGIPQVVISRVAPAADRTLANA